MSWDLIISYAEEAAEFTRELHLALNEAKLRVWCDPAVLKPGEKYYETFLDGLKKSDYAIVIISPESISSNGWHQDAIRELIENESEGGARVLPILHRLSNDDLRESLPLLADRVSGDSETQLQQLAQAIRNAVVHSDAGGKTGQRELSVLIDPGNASEELLTEFYSALSAYYLACGGSGLEIKKEERRSFIGEFA